MKKSRRSVGMQVALGAGVGVASGLALFYITNRHRERKERDLLNLGGVPNPRNLTRRGASGNYAGNYASPPGSPLRFEKSSHAATVSGTRKRRPPPPEDLVLRGEKWTEIMESAPFDSGKDDSNDSDNSFGAVDDIGKDVDSDGFEKLGLVDRLLEKCPCDTADHDQLHRDAHRTFPENRFFQNTDNQHLLKLILQALAAKYPDVGYVQGMNFIAAHLLFHTRSVDATFELCDWMWSHPRFDARRLFAKGLEVLKRLTATLDMLVGTHLPVLARHFREHEIGSILYAQRWFLTYFSYSLPYEPLALLWDKFLEEGYDVIFRLALWFLQSCQNRLLRCDFGEVLMILSDSVAEAPDDVVTLSSHIVLSSEDKALIARAICTEGKVAASPAHSVASNATTGSKQPVWESDMSDEEMVLISHPAGGARKSLPIRSLSHNFKML